MDTEKFDVQNSPDQAATAKHVDTPGSDESIPNQAVINFDAIEGIHTKETLESWLQVLGAFCLNLNTW